MGELLTQWNNCGVQIVAATYVCVCVSGSMREKVPFVVGPLQQERLGKTLAFIITRGQSMVEQYERHTVDCSC